MPFRLPLRAMKHALFCPTRLTLGFLFVVAYLSQAHSETPVSTGLIKICKKDNPSDYAEPGWWRREVMVPIGVEFRDVGTVDDASADWIRLKVVTMQAVSLKGDKRCAVVRAKIPSGQTMSELGRKPIGPIVQNISKEAGRLLEVMSWGRGSRPPDKLAPWADVVGVEATVEDDFR